VAWTLSIPGRKTGSPTSQHFWSLLYGTSHDGWCAGRQGSHLWLRSRPRHQVPSRAALFVVLRFYVHRRLKNAQESREPPSRKSSHLSFGLDAFCPDSLNQAQEDLEGLGPGLGQCRADDRVVSSSLKGQSSNAR
jgi:hypothetical protein